MALCKKTLIFSAIACLLLTAGCTNKPTPIMALSDAQNDSQMAFELIESNNIKQARTKITEGIAASPKAPSPWYTMGYLEEVIGNYKAADADFRKAIALAPNSGQAHNNYGTFLCHLGKFDAAIKQFTIATNEAHYYDTSSAYENAGLCALSNGKVDQAKNYFLAATSADPYMGHSLFELAFIYYNEKQYNQSKYYLDQYLRITENPGPKSKQLRALLKTKYHPALKQFLPEPVTHT